jgi:hypothetical protein
MDFFICLLLIFIGFEPCFGKPLDSKKTPHPRLPKATLWMNSATAVNLPLCFYFLLVREV